MTTWTPFRRAFLVVGAAGSETRIITKLLVENGCYGTDEHAQPTDGLYNPSLIMDKDFAVIRRSVPHNDYYPDLKQIYNYFHRGGFENIHVVITMRHPEYIAESQLKRKFTQSLSESVLDIKRAYKYIFDNLSPKYTISIYENLVANPEKHQRWLLKELGLEFKKLIEIENGNTKYEK